MAGSNNFTGQNIQDTYQRVLQLSSSLQLADGTGSLVSFLPISASYAFTSSVEVTKEISSSHANNADTASYVAAANIVQPFTHITASGNISASNNINANAYNIKGNAVIERNTNDIVLAGASDFTKIQIGKQNQLKPLTLEGNVTASGNISASGYIESEKIINPTVAGKSGNSNAILKVDATSGAYHSRIDFAKGGTVQWVLGSDTTAVHGSNNFRIIGGTALNTAQGLFITASNYNVGIGLITNVKSKLTVNGNIWATGSNGNITASGEISSSGLIISPNILSLTTTTGSLLTSIDTISNVTASYAVTGSNVIFNHITASGDISASGTVFATRIFVTGSKGVSGIISASLPKLRTQIDSDASRFGHILFNGLNQDQITLEAGSGNNNDGAKLKGKAFGGSYNIITPNQGNVLIGTGAGTVDTHLSGSNIKMYANGNIHLFPKNGETRFYDDQTLVFKLKADEKALSSEINNMFELQANLTASGDISASGAITTAELKGAGTTTGFETSGYISASQLYIGDSTNYVSASFGNISGSGNISGFTSMSVQYITASRIDVDGDTIKVGGETFNKTLLQNVKDGFSDDSRNQGKGSAVFKGGIFATHVTASGDISASGTVKAYNLHVGPGVTQISQNGRIYPNYPNSSINFIGSTATSIKINGGSLEVGGTGHITASGNISSSGNVIADIVYTDLIQSTGTSANLYTDSSFDELTIGYHGNLNSRLKINSHITASGNISASGEFIGHTFTHNVGYGSGRAFVLGGVPGRYYTYAGGDLGIGPLSGVAAVGTALGATVFVAPYSCSLEQIDWSLVLSDGTSTSQFLMQSRAVKLPAYNNTSNQVDIREIIAPDVNSFDSTVFDELRAYRVSHTYTGSTSALLGPGDSLCLIYSASAGGKHTGTGMATATFRKI